MEPEERSMSERSRQLVEQGDQRVQDARRQLLQVVGETRDRVEAVTGLRMRARWVAPVAAGVAGLAVALWLRRRS